jgi:hypothetical protein
MQKRRRQMNVISKSKAKSDASQQVVLELMDGLRISEAEASIRLEEVLQLLELAVSSGEELSPSPEVDATWHCILKRPASYETLCQQRYGRQIEHVPREDMDFLRRAYARTRALMDERFGPLDASRWPAEAATACSVRAPKA